jgi:hypothetical protein
VARGQAILNLVERATGEKAQQTLPLADAIRMLETGEYDVLGAGFNPLDVYTPAEFDAATRSVRKASERLIPHLTNFDEFARIMRERASASTADETAVDGLARVCSPCTHRVMI